MSDTLLPLIDVNDLITEDDTPVDNILSEREMRLLTESLYTSWKEPIQHRPFVALANVGIFSGKPEPPIVPDVLVSLDVELPADMSIKQNRSYMLWIYGKPPEVVVEIVSNNEGGEADEKMDKYARMGVQYYVIHDPFLWLSDEVLQVYELRGFAYRRLPGNWLTGVQLGVTLWDGVYEGMEATWLRWYDVEGDLLLTGEEQAAEQAKRAKREQRRANQARQQAELAYYQAEQAKQETIQERQRAEQEQQRAEQERQRAEQERQRAEQEQQRAEQERQRVERLITQLRALGIEPEV